MQKHIKILGAYLMVVSLSHICLYVAMNASHSFAGLFYFDSRIAFFFIEAVIMQKDGTPPALLSWMIELGILALGILMFSGRDLLKIFVVGETLLTIPYLLIFVFIVAANMSPNHGFSPAELFFPSLVVIISSLLPVSYAVWILWRSRRPKLDLT